jgi:predicted MPP superfamily phosphohydrolase
MYELPFELLIAIVIGGVPVWFVASRKKGWGPLHFLAALVWLVVAYGSFVEPRMLVTKDYAVDLRRTAATAPRSLDLAVISDLHLGKYRHLEWTQEVVDRVNALHPDAVLIAGDIATTASGIAAFPPLKDLKAPLGVYAVLGNWDYRAGAVDVRKALGSYGVKTLVNRSLPIDKDGTRFRLVGLDDLTYGRPYWEQALAEVEPGAIPIALSHSPDAVTEAEVHGVPLVIAGHTHGGQIRLPFIGPVPRIPTKLGNRYDRGTFLVGPVNLFITPGVGESGPRARLLQPPEVSFLHVTY